MKWFVMALVAVWVVALGLLIKPWVIFTPTGEMYGKSIARENDGMDGSCEEGPGGKWWDCEVETGFSDTRRRAIMWKDGRNCWTARFVGEGRAQATVDRGEGELPPGTVIKGKTMSGCVSVLDFF